jgi:DNA-binding NarL/FixJ family response regulator
MTYGPVVDRLTVTEPQGCISTSRARRLTERRRAAATDVLTSKTRVMIVTDHPIMRDGLRVCLRNAPDMDLVCEVADEAGIPAAVELCHPDAILIDLQLPEGAGMRATRAISRVAPRSALVVLTTFSHEEDMLHEINGPNILCVPKTASGGRLVAAIRQAVARHQQ